MVQLIETSISDEDIEFLLPRLSRINGMIKKEIQHEGEILEILFEYSPTKDNTDGIREQKEQIAHDAPLDCYAPSDITRSLYTKYRQHIATLDVNIDEIMYKKFISLQINGKRLVGIILKKSKITFDFKLPISEIDDPLKMLRDISQVGSWTSGKSRMNLFDETYLEYCINITKQCYDRIKDSTTELSNNESKQDKSDSHHMPPMYLTRSGH